MKRAIASLAMVVGLLLPAAPAFADHTRECTEVWVHFRPAVCTDQHDGVTWVWVCPDGWWNFCQQIIPFER